MAKLEVKFKPLYTKEKEDVIYYQVIHKSKSHELMTDYRLFDYEWDENKK